jgi:AcrR family transcriptional regulator
MPNGNREKLLRAALICLRDKGYAATTARDLAAVSGANLASIGYHFGGKEALLDQAIIEGFRAWTAEVEAATFADDGATPQERYLRSLAATVDRFRELHPYLVAFVEAFPRAVRSDGVRAGLAACYEEARQAGARMIERAVAEQGEALPPGAAATLSSLTLAVVDGLMLQWLLDPGAVPDSTAIVSALAAIPRLD